MDAQNKQCADPILEKLGLEHFYHGDKPLVWIVSSLRATRSNLDKIDLREDVALYNAEEKDFSQYFVKEGEFGPYASLLYDKTFKKMFSPDTRRGKRNLLNLLNDMLGDRFRKKSWMWLRNSRNSTTLVARSQNRQFLTCIAVMSEIILSKLRCRFSGKRIF